MYISKSCRLEKGTSCHPVLVEKMSLIPKCSFILLVFSAILIDGFPDGAPESACASLNPDPEAHQASAPQNSPSPYHLTLSQVCIYKFSGYLNCQP